MAVRMTYDIPQKISFNGILCVVFGSIATVKPKMWFPPGVKGLTVIGIPSLVCLTLDYK